jgi:hypothetical protein
MSDPRLPETIAGVQREFVAEALRIAGLKCFHGADDVAIHDDPSVERCIQIAILNLKEAAKAWRQLEALEAAAEAVESRQAKVGGRR